MTVKSLALGSAAAALFAGTTFASAVMFSAHQQLAERAEGYPHLPFHHRFGHSATVSWLMLQRAATGNEQAQEAAMNRLVLSIPCPALQQSVTP